MKYDTNIQKSITSIEGNPKLDKAVKELLADKQILARILKRVTDEFKYESFDTIMDAIEGKPEIAVTPVEPGLTNVHSAPNEAAKLKEDVTESSVQNEGTYFFDIRFSAIVPQSKTIDFGIRLLVDVEGQYDYYPGYDIVTRGVFYGARLISSQNGTEFIGDDYANLRKVYSIWICLSPPVYAGNSIVRFAIRPEILTGNIPQAKINAMKYDLMDVVLVFLSTNADSDKDELCGMLELLFDENIEKEEKLRLLENGYEIKRTYEFEREVDSVCDYSVGIAKKSEQKGENKLAKLMTELLSMGRTDDAQKAASDEQARQEFYREFNIID